jgi:hypothetical protein
MTETCDELTTAEQATAEPVYEFYDPQMVQWHEKFGQLVFSLGLELTGHGLVPAVNDAWRTWPTPSWCLSNVQRGELPAQWCDRGCGCAGPGPCWFCAPDGEGAAA